MDMLTVVVCIIIAILVIQFFRFVFADGDLTLLWAEKLGKKPEILKDQVVWITGCSTGIGEYLAYEFAKVGCRLVLSARSKNLLDDVKKKCQDYGLLNTEDILVLPMDITDLNSHKSATDQVVNTFGKVDILVNNAARSQRAWAIETELAVDQEMIHLNVVAQLSLTKCVLPHMIERRRGHIVITSSLAGKAGIPFSATYCLTKFAVNGWFSSLAVELRPKNIDVTIVCPGPVVSNLSKVAFVAKAGQMNEGSQENDKKRMPTQRCAQLMAIAIANRLGEVWISTQPSLAFAYLAQYMPTITRYLLSRIGIKMIMKAREGKI